MRPPQVGQVDRAGRRALFKVDNEPILLMDGEP